MSRSQTLRKPVPARARTRAESQAAGTLAARLNGPAVPAALAAIAVLVIAWQIAHVRGYTYGWWQGFHWDDYDEGVYLVSARALLHGQPIFSQVFSSQPPLFLAGLAVFLGLAGGAAGAGHLFSLCCALLALAGVGWLCWEIAGRWSAVLGVAVLALSPGFEIAARAVEAEAPMLGLGSLSVAAATRYARLGDRRWLIAASLLLAAAVLSKLLASALVLPLAVAIVLAALAPGATAAPGARTRAQARTSRARAAPPALIDRNLLRRLGADAALAAGCVLGPIILAFALLSPSDQYDQVVRFHLRASSAFPVSKPPNLDQIGTFFGWDPGLLALAVVGLAAAALSRRPLALIPLAWLVATIGSLVRYHPLFIHHLTVILAPLAALAGLALAFDQSPGLGLMRRGTVVLLLGSALVVYGVWLPVSIDHTRHAFVPDRDPAKAAYVGWLTAHSGPDDLVIVDNQTYAVAADRLVPPALTDTSIVRATSGYLPVSSLLVAAADRRVRAVLLTRELRYDPRYAPFRAWLRAHLVHVRVRPRDAALAFLR